MKSGKNTLVALIAGAFAGILTGILFAPDKGERTRREFSKKSRDYADMAREELEDYIDYMKEKYEGTKRQAEEMTEKGENVVNEVKGKVD